MDRSFITTNHRGRRFIDRQMIHAKKSAHRTSDFFPIGIDTYGCARLHTYYKELVKT